MPDDLNQETGEKRLDKRLLLELITEISNKKDGPGQEAPKPGSSGTGEHAEEKHVPK